MQSGSSKGVLCVPVRTRLTCYFACVVRSVKPDAVVSRTGVRADTNFALVPAVST